MSRHGNYKQYLRSRKWSDFQQTWFYKIIVFPVPFVLLYIIGGIVAFFFIVIPHSIRIVKELAAARKERKKIRKEVDKAILELEDQYIQSIRNLGYEEED